MKCRRCNRELKREPWRTKGIGKICEQKERINSESKRSEGDTDVITPYDGGDIFMERLAAPTYNIRGELELQMHTASGIKTNIQRIVTKHSPTGFNFGYGGSGPADAALNICLMFCRNQEDAHGVYQDFKWKFLGAQGDKLIIPKQHIIQFLQSKSIAVKQDLFRYAD